MGARGGSEEPEGHPQSLRSGGGREGPRTLSNALLPDRPRYPARRMEEPLKQREKGLDADPNSPNRHGLPKPAPRMMELSEPEEERRE